jgi:translation initiation factor 2 gamma subunit (eIF-2gamma)
LGHPGKLPDINVSIVVKTHLLKRLLGIKRGDKAMAHIAPIRIIKKIQPKLQISNQSIRNTESIETKNN